VASLANDLEMWLDRLATKLRSHDGVSVDIVAGDRLLGSTIAVVVTIGDRHAEIVVVRSRRRRSHVAVFADAEPTARRLAELLEAAYKSVGRFANSERKFVHRIERVARRLVEGWAEQLPEFPEEARARAASAFDGEVRAMLGRGYHVDIGGGDDGSDRHRYDPFDAISVPIGQHRRALIWDAHVKQFLVPAALRGAIDPARATAAGLALFAGAALAGEAVENQTRLAGGPTTGDTGSVAGDIAGDVLEATSEAICELPDVLSTLKDCAPDVSSCIPDCGSFDLPDCDIGGCDL
jgi:hypothetical protein